jgi:hypothetical protein
MSGIMQPSCWNIELVVSTLQRVHYSSYFVVLLCFRELHNYGLASLSRLLL